MAKLPVTPEKFDPAAVAQCLSQHCKQRHQCARWGIDPQGVYQVYYMASPGSHLWSDEQQGYVPNCKYFQLIPEAEYLGDVTPTLIPINVAQ